MTARLGAALSRLAGEIPGVRHHVLSGMAHVPQLEGYKETLDLIEEFADVVPGR